MIKNSINVPILFILILFISKEIFSYDSEKVVILCILSFLILAYYQTRTSLYEAFIFKSAKLEEEFKVLSEMKLTLEKNIRSFWRIFLDLEDQLIEILFWVKNNVVNFIKKANKNRALFAFHIIKDQLNILLKDNLNVKTYFNNFSINATMFNFKLLMTQQIDNPLNKSNLDIFLNKLTDNNNENQFKLLLLNKLNIDRVSISENGNIHSSLGDLYLSENQ